MKKYITFVLAISVALGSGCSLALAQNAPETQVEKKAEIQAERKEKALNHSKVMLQRFKTTLERIGVLGLRLESRLAKFIDSGAENTGEPRNKLIEARKQWDRARANIEAFPALVDKALENPKAKEAFAQIKTAGEAIRDDLKGSHAKLVEAIALVKELKLGSILPN